MHKAAGSLGVTTAPGMARLFSATSALAKDRLFLTGLALRLLAVLAVLVVVAVWPAFARSCATQAVPADLIEVLACSSGVIARAQEWYAIPLILLILVCEILVYLLLMQFGSEERRREVVAIYWMSPLAILLSFWIGVLSIVATIAVLAAFIMLERRDEGAAGALFGAAIVALPALVLVVPILLLYVASVSRLRSGARPLISGLAAVGGAGLALRLAGAAVTGGDAGGRDLVRIIEGAAIPYGADLSVSLVPIVLVGLLYVAWRMRIFDERLVIAMITLALLAMVTLGGMAATLTLVLLPFLAHHAAYAETSGRALVTLFSLLLAVWFLGIPTMATTVLGDAGLASSLTVTAIVAVGAVLFTQVLQRGVLRAPSFLAHRRTVCIGIAGDSGVGKDTLVAGIASLFSPRLVAMISGDDYHAWDRNKPMWRALTHLNPKANDLAAFRTHVGDVVDRRWVRARHYDHSTGRMTKPVLIRPGEVVIVSGLHALWSPELNVLYDLRVYLDMDEPLRRYLKIKRDAGVRGHPVSHVLASIERRHGDAVAFVHPQKEAAHLSISVAPRKPEMLEKAESIDGVPLMLRVKAAPGIVLDGLARDLVSVCGIQAVVGARPSGASELVVAGKPSKQAIAVVARRIAPEMTRLFRSRPEWEGDLRGVIQLVIIDQLEQLHLRRGVNA